MSRIRLSRGAGEVEATTGVVAREIEDSRVEVRAAVPCPACGAGNVVGASFCGDCGTRLTEPSPSEQEPPPAEGVRWSQESISVAPAAPNGPEPLIQTLRSEEAEVRKAPASAISPESVICPTCGCHETQDSRFCGGCGESLSTTTPGDVPKLVAAEGAKSAEPSPMTLPASPSTGHRAPKSPPPVPLPAIEPPARRRRAQVVLVTLIVVVLVAAGVAAALILSMRSSSKASSPPPPPTVTVRTPARTVTEAAATSVTPSALAQPAAASPDLLPPESRSTMTQEIQAVLLQYHEQIVGRNAAT